MAHLSQVLSTALGTVGVNGWLGRVKSIFMDRELQKDSAVWFCQTTAAEGKPYEVEHDSLDMVLTVGSRVRSQAFLPFRQWPVLISKSSSYIQFLPGSHQLSRP